MAVFPEPNSWCCDSKPFISFVRSDVYQKYANQYSKTAFMICEYLGDIVYQGENIFAYKLLPSHHHHISRTRSAVLDSKFQPRFNCVMLSVCWVSTRIEEQGWGMLRIPHHDYLIPCRFVVAFSGNIRRDLVKYIIIDFPALSQKEISSKWKEIRVIRRGQLIADN